MAFRTGTGELKRPGVEATALYQQLVETYGDDPVTVARIREACEVKAMLDEIDSTKRSRAERGRERLRWSRQYDALLSALDGGGSGGGDTEPEQPPTATERRFPGVDMTCLLNDTRVMLRHGWEPGSDDDRLFVRTRGPEWKAEAIEFLERHDPSWLQQWRESSAPGGRYEQAKRARMAHHAAKVKPQ